MSTTTTVEDLNSPCSQRNSPTRRRREESSVSQPAKSVTSFGVGLMVLMLASLANKAVGPAKLLDDQFTEDWYHSTPASKLFSNLEFFAAYSNIDGPKRIVSNLFLTEDEEDELERSRVTLAQHSPSQKSGADSTQDTDEIASVGTSSSCFGLMIDDGVMHMINKFLPLSDLNNCRLVSQRWLAAVNLLAPTPVQNSVFIRFPIAGDCQRGRRFAVAPPRNALKWHCGHCSAMNNITAEDCIHCAASRDVGYGPRRLFLGQLRRERTVEMVEWLVAMLFPEINLLHIENHTNAKDQRGKGCAWVYVQTAEDEQKLLTLNKRLFMDIGDDGSEGLWMVRHDQIEYLQHMSSAQAYIPHRPTTLPRQPLVVERPAGRPGATPRANFDHRRPVQQMPTATHQGYHFNYHYTSEMHAQNLHSTGNYYTHDPYQPLRFGH